MKQIKREDYKELFRMTGNLTCLHTELFIKGSLGVGDPIIVFKDGIWHSFINKKKEKDCLNKGLEVFSSKEKYKRYSEEFREYIKSVKEEIIPKYANVPKTITKEEFVGLIPILGKFWYYYGFTEFSYHNLAYEVMEQENDPVLQENLKDLGSLKFKGREIMNAFLFEQGVLPNILTFLSRKYLYKEDDAMFLNSEEILDLFDGYKLPEKIIEDRKKCYAFAKICDNITTFSYEESLRISQKFTRFEVLKGIIASKGKAEGKVVIAPMLTDMERVNKVVAKMNKGDILVAQSTTPELIGLCHKAAAIVTDQGGMLSHAAVISRELNIPCIIGTSKGTVLLKDGDRVEVDANTGVVNKIM